jgi:hypothetical protein
MVGADSRRISRAPRYLGYELSALLISHLQDFHFLWLFVPEQFSLTNCLSRGQLRLYRSSRFPYTATCSYLHSISFWLFPFRSPLLRESLRFLFLALLRCFSSRRSLPYSMNSNTDAWIQSRRVAPFGNLRINARLTAPRSLQQSPASFFAS